MFRHRYLLPDEPPGAGGSSPLAEAAGKYSCTVRSVDTHDALPAPLGLVPLGDTDRVLLTPIHALRLRSQLTQAAQMLGWDGERLDALLDAADALAESALAHGVGGELQLRASTNGEVLQVWVQDREPNVEVTLAVRQSVAACDQVTLLTDAAATTWVIEQHAGSGTAP